MPYSDPERQREAKRKSARKRRREAKLKAEAAPDLLRPETAQVLAWPDRPADALRLWCKSTLVVPAGHPSAGEPMVLPDFAYRWLAEALVPDVFDAGLFVSRKNGKSAIVAVLLLACLVGPLRIAGFKGAVVSVDKIKAGLMLGQMREIAQASRLEGLRFYTSPAPGRVVGPSGEVIVLSADKSSGHAHGLDIVVVDELGLLETEKDRALLNGLRTSMGAKDGRMLAISIIGGGDLSAEMIARHEAGAPGLVVHIYAADDKADPHDERQWHKANPGLATGIKSIRRMRHDFDQARLTPADLAHFQAFDLNMRLSPSRVVICTAQDWAECEVDELPERRGRCYVGIDLGGAKSMSCFVQFWPVSGRLEAYGAFAADPDLKERGEKDGVGLRYVRMKDRGELRTYPGQAMRPADFIRDCLQRLKGEHIAAIGADRYRKEDVYQELAQAGYRGRVVLRGTGAHAKADGSHDVRAFQLAVLTRQFRVRPSLLWASAIMDSDLRFDEGGNPALNKSRQRGRIDCLSAGVIASGLAKIGEAVARDDGQPLAVAVAKRRR